MNHVIARIPSALALVAPLLLLSACGGGGNADAGNTQVFAPAAAWHNLRSTSHNWVMTGDFVATGSSSGSGNASAVRTETVSPDGLFPYDGLNAKRRLTDISLSYGGGSYILSSIDYLNTSSDLLRVGRSFDGGCEAATSLTAIPDAARLGQSGTWATWTLRDSCSTGAAVVGSGSSTWSIDAIGSKIYLCETQTNSYTDGSVDTEKFCADMLDTAGTMGSSARYTIVSSDSSSSITFRLATSP